MELSMRARSVIAAVAFVAAVALPGIAAAQTVAYAVPGTTNVRAGPSTSYPVITQVRGGTPVEVFGCLSDYSWCDILVYGLRGWIYAPRLEFVYSGRRVLVPNYYAYFNVPIITFGFDYWRRFYRDRPWYDDWGGGGGGPPVQGGGPGGPEIEGPGARPPSGWRNRWPQGGDVPPPVVGGGGPGAPGIEGPGAAPSIGLCPPNSPNCGY